eukprot:TRINITY_DN220_c3_g1_i1.p1 TRINITY_DN220_c3_g1~~TRINITY_DN220_c3_g1_i1.p1  ORF type:complete len:715 (+),score=122.45 TRINITY_DN220_c3_g1_i1:222-2366(+)
MNDHLSICMVSDFFYPSIGGVEEHIWALSQELMRRNHKVIVLTHIYDGRHGLKYMTNGLKVYYLPFVPIWKNGTLPSMFCRSFPIYRKIFSEEGIQVVHGHQSCSYMAQAAYVCAKFMGLSTCHTDHSLYEFANINSFMLNKTLQYAAQYIDHAVAVSKVCRSNFVERSCIRYENMSVIPNALDSSRFIPKLENRPSERLVIVMISRLVTRKGIGLAVDIIPSILDRFDHVDFLIGGDGDQRLLLEEMREQKYYDRVNMLGAVPHSQVGEVLSKGHIFFNTSLTESFCIAILEAACAGLEVVTTNVGGIPEVLPSHLVQLCNPNVEDAKKTLISAIENYPSTNPIAQHKEVKDLYTWQSVADRTLIVYDKILKQEPLSTTVKDLLKGTWQTFPFFWAFIYSIAIITASFWHHFWEWYKPLPRIRRDLNFVNSQSKDVNVINATTSTPPQVVLPSVIASNSTTKVSDIGNKSIDMAETTTVIRLQRPVLEAIKSSSSTTTTAARVSELGNKSIDITNKRKFSSPQTKSSLQITSRTTTTTTKESEQELEHEKLCQSSYQPQLLLPSPIRHEYSTRPPILATKKDINNQTNPSYSPAEYNISPIPQLLTTNSRNYSNAIDSDVDLQSFPESRNISFRREHFSQCVDEVKYNSNGKHKHKHKEDQSITKSTIKKKSRRNKIDMTEIIQFLLNEEKVKVNTIEDFQSKDKDQFRHFQR